MGGFRFVLQKYTGPRSRGVCPRCKGFKCYTRYVDLVGKYVFPIEVGRCNHENSCGYHLTPKMFFEHHPEEMRHACFGNEGVNNDFYRSCGSVNYQQPKVLLPSYMPNHIMQRSKRSYESNHFMRFLYSLFDELTVSTVLQRYHIGTANLWKGATVFWQVDVKGNIHDGKVMLYDPMSGHRTEKVSWAHSAMKMKNYVLEQCFFGEHLLVDTQKPVAIVESEKTAIIASVFLDGFIWLASGGKDGCFNKRKHVLVGRKVVLFPDLKATSAWQEKARVMTDDGIQTEVSTFLEEHATDEERERGLDIADYIIRHFQEEKKRENRDLTLDKMKMILAGMQVKNPAITTLINKLNLVLVKSLDKRHIDGK